MKRKPRLLLFALILGIIIPLTAPAENIDDSLTNAQRKVLIDVESSILSPFCKGRLLKDCPSSAANKLRKDIKEKILSNTPKDRILEELYVEYGKELKAVPSTKGFGGVAWFAPIVFLLIGFLLIYKMVGKKSEDSP